MIMNIGEQWHCTNPACHCEVLVQTRSGPRGKQPALRLRRAHEEKIRGPGPHLS